MERRYYPMHASFRATAGGPPELIGYDCEFIVNADGSVWVSDWDHLEAWREFMCRPENCCSSGQEAGALLLLFAARDGLRQVSREESEAVALKAAESLPPPPDFVIRRVHTTDGGTNAGTAR
jgi:hypothetical protein